MTTTNQKLLSFHIVGKPDLYHLINNNLVKLFLLTKQSFILQKKMIETTFYVGPIQRYLMNSINLLQ